MIQDKIQEEYCQGHVFGEFFYNKEYTIKALKEAYTLGRNKTVDWFSKQEENLNYIQDKWSDYVISEETFLIAKTCKELDV